MLYGYFLYLISILIFLFFINNKNYIQLRRIGIGFSANLLSYILWYLPYFDTTINHFQSITEYSFALLSINLGFRFGFDGIAVLFFILTELLIFLSVLYVLKEQQLRLYLFYLAIINLFLLLSFSSLNLFLFYFFFEAILIPMYFMIGDFGVRNRKAWAAYLLFFFTICSSLLFLIGILYIIYTKGTADFNDLLVVYFSETEEKYLWISFFFAFAIKVPLFPFHIWLPEAHVEAPTVGSVLLAGILLKLGLFGFIRYSLPIFPYASLYFSPLVCVLGALGVVFGSFSALMQDDLKRIIAYSSVAHMNLIIMGVFSCSCAGIEGSILQGISHGIVSSALFFLIGMLQHRYSSRNVHQFSGLSQVMPIFSAFFFIFTLANLALPGTSSFIGEFFLFYSIYSTSYGLGLVVAPCIFLSAMYSLWSFNRMFFGNFKDEDLLILSDINLREFYIIFCLFFVMLFIGLFPETILLYIRCSVTAYYITFFE